MFESAVWLTTDAPVRDVVELARTAEEAGYDYFMVPDEGLTRDVFVLLSAIAVATTRIKIGPGITNPYTRHPVTSAVAMASVHELSGGRGFMGWGIGGSLVLKPLGYVMDRPVRIMREALEITSLVLSGQSFSYEGEFFHVRDVKVPFACPDMPIYMAARGSQMLKLCGELTDGPMLLGKARFDLDRTMGEIEEGARKSGRHPKTFYSTHVAYDPGMLDSIRPNYTFMIVDSPEHIHQTLGLGPDDVRQIRDTMLSEGTHAAAKYITDDMLRQYIVMGNDRECSAQIAGVMTGHKFDVFCLPLSTTEGAGPMLRRVNEIVAAARASG
jgi:5,10-methylenetetrahydromethanopterin reductase